MNNISIFHKFDRLISVKFKNQKIEKNIILVFTDILFCWRLSKLCSEYNNLSRWLRTDANRLLDEIF